MKSADKQVIIKDLSGMLKKVDAISNKITSDPDLLNELQKQAQCLQACSNVLKAIHDMEKAIARNIR